MTTKGPILKQHTLLLRKDSQYVVGLLLSIIKDDDYEDLGNHAIEAMGSQVSLAWLRCTTVLLPFHSSTIILISNLLLTLAMGADDERSDGPLFGPRAMGQLLKGEG